MVRKITCQNCYKVKEWLVGNPEPNWITKKCWVQCGVLVNHEYQPSTGTPIIVDIKVEFCSKSCLCQFKAIEKRLLTIAIKGKDLAKRNRKR